MTSRRREHRFRQQFQLKYGLIMQSIVSQMQTHQPAMQCMATHHTHTRTHKHNIMHLPMPRSTCIDVNKKRVVFEYANHNVLAVWQKY